MPFWIDVAEMRSVIGFQKNRTAQEHDLTEHSIIYEINQKASGPGHMRAP